MKTSKILAVILIIAVAIIMLCAPAVAKLRDPDFIVYGVAGDGVQVVSFEVDGEELTSYTMGSHPDAGEYYVLRVPMDDGFLLPQVPGTAVPGENATILADDLPVRTLLISEPGVIQMVHLVGDVPEDCADGFDNDGDGDIDCADTDCGGLTCDDGLYCNGADLCAGGTCSEHEGNPCAPMTCNEATDSCAGSDADGDGMDDGWEQQIVDDDLNDNIDSIYDVLTGDDYDGDGKTNLEEYQDGTDPTQADGVRIPLKEGWNWFGYTLNEVQYVTGKVPTVEFATSSEALVYSTVDSMADVLASIEGKYSYMRSFDINGGQIYKPGLPPFVTQIEYMGPGYGYQIKMDEEGDLVLTGELLEISAIMPLQTGWNWMAYWWDEVQHVAGKVPTVDFATPPVSPVYREVSSMADVLASIDGKYSYMRSFDVNGGQIYKPGLPPFVTQIEYMGPGYGYQIKMDEDGNLSYEAGVLASSSSRQTFSKMENKSLRAVGTNAAGYYHPIALTGEFISLWGRIAIEGEPAQAGDEIGFFTGDICVGAYKVTSEGYYGAVAVYGDDPVTPEKDGAEPGDEMNIRIWDASEAVEYMLSSDELSGVETLQWTFDGDLLRVDIGDGMVCVRDTDCDDGDRCNGEETCREDLCWPGDPINCGDSNGTGGGGGSGGSGDDTDPECSVNAECDNGIFCDGEEICLKGVCASKDAPCSGDEICDEITNECRQAQSSLPGQTCVDDSDCANGLFCDGEEACIEGICIEGDVPCATDDICLESDQDCIETITISGETLMKGKTLRRPFFRENLCRRVMLKVEDPLQSDYSITSVMVEGPSGETDGIEVNGLRNRFKMGRFTVIPINVCIDSEGSAGVWKVKLDMGEEDDDSSNRLVIEINLQIQ